MAWPEPTILENDYCLLEPLKYDHHDALVEAVKDGELWNIHYALVPTPQEMKNEIANRLDLQKQGLMLPFTVIHKKTKKVVGMTSYCRIDNMNKRLDIGYTWYAKSHQKTALNTECKLTLLRHAFEKLNCIAVGFRIDFLNQPSRKAVERLGAKFEGVVRNYSIMPNGNTRDMCFYSILPHEWLHIKTHLRSLLDRSDVAIHENGR